MDTAAAEGLSIKPGAWCYAGWAAAAAVLLWVAFATPPEGLSVAGFRAAGVGLAMGLLWMTEALPLPITALLPLVLFPMFGVATLKEASMPFADSVIFLYMGGFMMSLAMQRWGLHRRIAMHLIARTGTRARSIVWGFLLATALLSMWVSNTATTMMMLPIALSVAQLLGKKDGESLFPAALMLAIAYGATIGGLGTPIGTPTNAVFIGFAEKNGISVSFLKWMTVGVPLMALALPVTHWILTRFSFHLENDEVEGAKELIQSEIAGLGKMNRGEWVTALVFASAALCWVGRQFVVDLLPSAPIWLKTSSADTIIALLGAMLLFVVPVSLKKGQFVLEWKQASKLPWDVLILFGGGLSVAAAFESTLFAQWLGAQAAVLQGLPLWMIIGIIVLSIIFLSELASNVATCTAFLPVAAALAVGMGSHPLLLAVPATLAASAAFMLPVGTPPNAIVFGTGLVTMRQMVRAGIWLNLSFAVMITLFGVTLVRWVFGV